ncbi:alpha amylase family protein [Neobacillus niacini]|uniref:alpha amylase family protein n=1 Tax=Neobacillus niacini TaxID=86668 RepID=UPI0006949EB0|nr:alpha amylase family protein [Neobacillus niacini]
MSRVLGSDSNILWVDFLANATKLSLKSEREKLIKNAVTSGITHLVVDAKIPYGQTTYQSQYAKHVSSWSDGRFHMWKDRDFLQEMLDEAKGSGVKVLANMDVFAEGTAFSKDGMVYDKPEWKVKSYNEATASIATAAENAGDKTIFVNPIHPEVVHYENQIIKELVSSYQIDGIVLDRCRYPNIYGDFSELSRETFEEYIGESIEKWPLDILEVEEGTKKITFGKHFAKWTEWRALNIKTFVQGAKQIMKSINPDLIFTIYVGSWYPLYYNEGVNWGSTTYQPSLDWVSENYHQSGYADELDFIMTGCYYPEVTIQEAEANQRPASWYSVEGAIDLSLEAINGQIPVIGSLYLKDYKDDPEQFKQAIRMCKQKSSGVMLFDVVYLDDYQWWEEMGSILLPEKSRKK